MLANSLALDGGAIQATDDSANAILTHSAMTFANHKVDTQVIVVSNLNQPESSGTVTISADQTFSFEVVVARLIGTTEVTLQEVTLDVKTPSETLEVTVRAVSRRYRHQEYTYSGSVTTAGLQTFVLDSRSSRYATITAAETDPSVRFDLYIEASGTGAVELAGTTSSAEDAGGLTGATLSNPETSAAPVPQVRLAGYAGGTAHLVYGDVISSPIDGTAYAAGEQIVMLFVLAGEVYNVQGSSSTPFQNRRDISVPIWLGAGAQHRREARAVVLPSINVALTVLVLSYTVQQGDMDTDGIYIPANPLGDNASTEFRSFDVSVPADMRLPENQLGTGQAVDGSRARVHRIAMHQDGCWAAGTYYRLRGSRILHGRLLDFCPLHARGYIRRDRLHVR